MTPEKTGDSKVRSVGEKNQVKVELWEKKGFMWDNAGLSGIGGV